MIEYCTRERLFTHTQTSRERVGDLLRLDATCFACSLLQIISGNMHFLVCNIPSNRNYLHSIQKGVRYRVQNICCAHKENLHKFSKGLSNKLWKFQRNRTLPDMFQLLITQHKLNLQNTITGINAE